MAEPTTQENSIGALYVDVKTRLDKFEEELKRIERKNEEASNKMSSAFSKVGKAAVAAMAGLQVGNFLKTSIQESIDASKAIAKVNQAVVQTGGSAGYTTEQLASMAKQLESINAIDGDKILNDVTLQLLTFGNISDETFSRAQQAVLDLSATIGSDLVSQSIQLGKALDNPVKGLAALQRVGIMFTETQKTQIENLVKHNKLGEAQKIILDEINSKYGGQAKAQAEATKGVQSAAVEWGNLKEEIGNLFGPFLSTWLPEAVKGVKGLIILLQGFSDTVAAGSGKDLRQKEFFNSIRKQKNESDAAFKARISQESDIISKRLEEQKVIMINNGTMSQAYKTAAAMATSYEEQLSVLKNIAQWEAKARPKKIAVTSLTDEEKKAIEETQKKKLDAETEYYETVKFNDKNYFNWRLDQITKEAENYKKLLGSKFDEEVFANNEVSLLKDEQNEYIYEQEQERKNKDLSKTLAIEEITAANKLKSIKAISEDQIKKYEDEASIRMNIEEEIQQARISSTQEILNSIQQISNQLGISGESYFAWILKALQVMNQIRNISSKINSGESDSTGGFLSIFSTALSFIGMEKGGSFSNFGSGRYGYNSYRRFASGTKNFVVPSGYPTDSYPIFVKSGETVDVRPIGAPVQNYGINDGLIAARLSELIRVNRGMNNNLILLASVRPEFNANIDSIKFTENEVNISNKKLQRIGKS